MKLWQLILLLGNCFHYWTSATAARFHPLDTGHLTNSARRLPRSSNDSLTYKLCITDGIVESIEEATEAGNCTLTPVEILSHNVYHNILQLCSRGIKGFKKNWYRITDPSIEYINLNDNEITHFSSQLANDLPSHITGIISNRNPIEMIEANEIKNENLQELYFHRNNITMGNEAFKELKLIGLHMAYNLLNDSEFIKTLPSTLETLDLQQNSITEISSDTFSNLMHLKTFFLDANKVRELEPGSLNSLKDLEWLSLSHNLIRELKSGLFRGLKKLMVVDFRSNEIETIHPNAFESSSIRHLRLERNKLKIIKKESFSDTSFDMVFIDFNVTTEEGAFHQTEILRRHPVTDQIIIE